MSLTTVSESVGSERGFPLLLKTWRHKRRLSQLDLALSSGVSQRHVSFLESGRARPSRGMILQLSETLEVPLRERNDWLTAAGFAPVFKARPLDHPQMNQVMNAVRMMLTNHEPFPALAVDRAWNIRMANAPFELLSATLGADAWSRIGGAQRNLMRLFFHPNGIKPFIANWNAIAPLLWQRAQKEADRVRWAGDASAVVGARTASGRQRGPDRRRHRAGARLTARDREGWCAHFVCSPSSRRSERRRTSPPTNCASRASFLRTTPRSNSSAPPPIAATPLTGPAKPTRFSRPGGGVRARQGTAAARTIPPPV